MNRRRLRWIAGALLLAAAVAAFFWLPLGQLAERLFAWIKALGPWGPVAIAAVYVPASVLFVPGTLISLGAGFLYGPIIGTAAVSCGSTAGAAAAFVLGRTLFRPWIQDLVGSRAKFVALDRAVAAHGFRVVLLARLSPLFPFNLVNYAFGLTRISFGRFVLASWLGMLPGTLMYVYLGSAAQDLADVVSGKSPRTTGQWLLLATGLAATVGVSWTLARIARQALGAEVSAPTPADATAEPPHPLRDADA
jgi:uncharacterized membrane protein YdjX (TVP38/TMEM64 family)